MSIDSFTLRIYVSLFQIRIKSIGRLPTPPAKRSTSRPETRGPCFAVIAAVSPVIPSSVYVCSFSPPLHSPRVGFVKSGKRCCHLKVARGRELVMQVLPHADVIGFCETAVQLLMAAFILPYGNVGHIDSGMIHIGA
jgi:hypothetical protein